MSSQTYLTEEQKTWPIETYHKEQIVEYVPSVTDPTTYRWQVAATHVIPVRMYILWNSHTTNWHCCLISDKIHPTYQLYPESQEGKEKQCYIMKCFSHHRLSSLSSKNVSLILGPVVETKGILIGFDSDSFLRLAKKCFKRTQTQVSSISPTMDNIPFCVYDEIWIKIFSE